MIQLNAVYFVLLLEAVLLLLGLSGFLSWRLLRRPRAALSTPDDLAAQARRFLQSELTRTESLLDDDEAMEEDRRGRLGRRRDAIEAELAALELTDSETAYWERVESGYEAPAVNGETEPQPETDQDGDTAEADGNADPFAALAALKADYDALLRALEHAELEGEIRQEVDAATNGWQERLIIIERQLRRSGFSLADMSSGGNQAGSAERFLAASQGDSGERERLRQIIGQQDELIWDLKKDMASAISDSEKLKYLEERIDNIMRQARELQACVNVLEDENNFLFQQLRERDNQSDTAGSGSPDPLNRAHLTYLASSQRETLDALGAAIEGLEANDADPEQLAQARSALAELHTCTESLQASLAETPTGAPADAEEQNS